MLRSLGRPAAAPPGAFWGSSNQLAVLLRSSYDDFRVIPSRSRPTMPLLLSPWTLLLLRISPAGSAVDQFVLRPVGPAEPGLNIEEPCDALPPPPMPPPWSS